MSVSDDVAVLPTQRTREHAPGLDLPLPDGASASATPAPQRRVHTYRRLARVAMVADGLVIVLAIALAWPLRGLIPFAPQATAEGVQLALMVSPVLLAWWLLMLSVNDAYSHQLFGWGYEEFRAIGKATAVAAIGSAALCYLANLPLSRGFLAGMFILGLPLLLLERVALRKWQLAREAGGHAHHRTLLVGEPNAVAELARVLDRHQGINYDVVGAVASLKGAEANPLISHWIPDGLDDLRATCLELGADTVLLVGGGFDLQSITWDLEGAGVDVVVVPHLADVAAPRMFMRPLAGLPLLYVEEPQAHRARGAAKRAFDIAVASLALLVLSPIMLLTAALIRLGDKGPALYRQRRVGLHGEVFSCLKFRSMHRDADKIEARLREEQGHSGALWKMENDPRITPVGRFIRRFSIDELPQLFNVLNGSMSLVGPRPQQQWEVDTYSDIARRRLHVRPGMTGLWQVSGRSKLSFDEAIRLDLYYRDNWSMLVDLSIIAKTVKAVVGSDGAY
jgi:exopolysaccharide biosynthesis polyprenyl glycosylphosphotransferase